MEVAVLLLFQLSATIYLFMLKCLIFNGHATRPGSQLEMGYPLRWGFPESLRSS